MTEKKTEEDRPESSMVGRITPGSPEHHRLASKLKNLEITDMLTRIEALED